MKKSLLLCFAVVCFFCSGLYAQDNPTGGWYIGNIRYNFNQKWGLFAELQSRSFEVVNRFFYHEVKGGASYNYNKSAQFLIGTGSYTTYNNQNNFKDISSKEWRFWQQFILSNDFGRFKVEHRYRAEQRFFTHNNTYRNRFRYRLNAIVALNHSSVRPKSIFVNAYDEIFLNNEAPHFERNRFYIGGGYQFSKVVSLQAGYLNQYDYTPATQVSKGFIQLAFYYTINSHKSDRLNLTSED